MDSVNLKDLWNKTSSRFKPDEKSPEVRCAKLLNVKVVIILFVLFLLVISDVFTNNVIGMFGGCVKGRQTTMLGSIVQGIFLVLLFMVALYLIDNKII